jgi:MOSC domain-containing protein
MLRIRAEFAADLGSVTLSARDDDRGIRPIHIAFPQGTDAAAEWFSAYFEQRVIVRHSRNGYPDDAIANGPTIISTASLEAVCRWFPSIDLHEARRRFRTTLEINGADEVEDKLPAFWEDRLFGPASTYAVRFRIGEVNFEGSNPCARCSVPPRDSRTGANLPDFQKRFCDLRREHLPPWASAEHFDHYYRLAVNTRVAFAEAGKILRVGDPLQLT